MRSSRLPSHTTRDIWSIRIFLELFEFVNVPTPQLFPLRLTWSQLGHILTSKSPGTLWHLRTNANISSFLLKNIWTQANFRGKHDNVHETLWFPSWHSKFSNITGSFYKQHAMYMFSSAGEMPWLFLNKQQHDSKASAQCVTMILYTSRGLFWPYVHCHFGPMWIVNFIFDTSLDDNLPVWPPSLNCVRLLTQATLSPVLTATVAPGSQPAVSWVSARLQCPELLHRLTTQAAAVRSSHNLKKN